MSLGVVRALRPADSATLISGTEETFTHQDRLVSAKTISIISRTSKVFISKSAIFKSKHSYSCNEIDGLEPGHSGEFGNGAKLVGKMSKSVMQLISIHF